VKGLLFTLLDPLTLSQAIVLVVRCDNMFLEHQQERCHELTSTTQRNFPLAMLTQPSTTLPKDNPMQIDKIIFKSLMEQEKQCQCTNNLCLYCGKLGHGAHECPKKCGPHAACTISITNPQP
jgi:hypothetical protein